MATATITPDQDTIIAEVFIAAPPERVFAAITDPAQMPLWWGQRDMYRITEWKADLRVGGKWQSDGVGADGKPFGVGGEYLEVDPPRRLVYTWIASWTGALATTVRWQLERAESPQQGTIVRLRHEGFAAAPQAAGDHSEGWKRVFGWLTAYLERGETVDTRA